MQETRHQYEIYSHDAYIDLIDDEEWVAECAEAYSVDPEDVTSDMQWNHAYDLEAIDYREEVDAVSARLAERTEALHPEWGGSVLIAAGSIGRWDGTRHGYQYYRTFDDLVSDTGYDGLFKDCEISRIWEERDGSLHVEGAHHDGTVVVEVRAVPYDTEDFEYEDPGEVTRRWEAGIGADMAGLYGYVWPDQTPQAVRTDARDAIEAARVGKGQTDAPVQAEAQRHGH